MAARKAMDHIYSRTVSKWRLVFRNANDLYYLADQRSCR